MTRVENKRRPYSVAAGLPGYGSGYYGEKMMRLILLIAIAALAGCENGNFTPTDAGRASEKARVQKRGDARMALFKECLTLAAKITRQAEDDVSDIVKECSTQAYYATHYIE